MIWQRIDRPGHEWAHLSSSRTALQLEGIVLLAHNGWVVRLEYRIVCDSSGHTRSVDVHGSIGRDAIHRRITCRSGTWTMDGRRVPAVSGCLDVDLAFSPSTNTLPVRRLGLVVGASAVVRAAWLRFPELDLVPLTQVYRRIDERTWCYESGNRSFRRMLEVDDQGLVVDYPGFWERIARS